MYKDLDSIKNLVADSIHYAKSLGATDSEASCSISHGLSAEVRLRKVDTVEFSQDQGFGVTVYKDKRKGGASTSDISWESIKKTIDKAYSIATHIEEDEYSGIADKELLAFDITEENIKDLDVYHPWDLPAEKAIEMALACEETAFSLDKKITNADSTSLSSQQSMGIYGNSHGFLNGYPTTSHSLSCVLIAGEGANMQRDYYYTAARDHKDLKDSKEVAKKAVEKTIMRLNPKKIKSQKTKILFTPNIAKGLIGNLLSAISGGNLYRESSFLLGKIDQKIFPDFVTISENPHIAKALGSVLFDSDGLKTHDKIIVASGILQTYLLGVYSARRLGLKPTANGGGTHNIIIEPTSGNMQDLAREMGTGLIVSEVMGQGVNIVTGDYSRGAFGFWVENGEIQHPVSEITIAGNLKDMFMNILAIGNDIDLRGNIRSGSILIDNMTVAGG